MSIVRAMISNKAWKTCSADAVTSVKARPLSTTEITGSVAGPTDCLRRCNGDQQRFQGTAGAQSVTDAFRLHDDPAVAVLGRHAACTVQNLARSPGSNAHHRTASPRGRTGNRKDQAVQVDARLHQHFVGIGWLLGRGRWRFRAHRCVCSAVAPRLSDHMVDETLPRYPLDQSVE